MSVFPGGQAFENFTFNLVAMHSVFATGSELQQPLETGSQILDE